MSVDAEIRGTRRHEITLPHNDVTAGTPARLPHGSSTPLQCASGSADARRRGFVAGSGPDGYRANVRTFMKRIRQKFRELDEDFDEIENYPGFGYRWRQPA